jgi:hypothetical protein
MATPIKDFFDMSDLVVEQILGLHKAAGYDVITLET